MPHRRSKIISAIALSIFILISLGFKANATGRSNLIRFNTPLLNWQMLNYYSGVGRERNLIKIQNNLSLKARYLVSVGGLIKTTVTAIKHEQPGSANTTETRIDAPQLRLNAILIPSSFLLAYIQLDSTTSKRSALNIKKAYLLIDKTLANQAKIYGFIGKKTINFGYFANFVDTDDSFNLTNLVALYFKAQGNALGLGYMSKKLNMVISLLNGQNNDIKNTGPSNQLNNFALNLFYHAASHLNRWRLGIGYLNAPITKPFESETTKWNGVYDLNAAIWLHQVGLLAEYASTLKRTKLTHKRASALTAGIDYHFILCNKATIASFQYSWANAQFFTQPALSISPQSTYSVELRQQSLKNLWLALELSRSNSIVSLNGVNDTSLRLIATAVF